MVNKKLLSKSGMNCFMQCPYKWKRFYVDKEKSIASPQMERGTNIHKKIERFYKKNNIHKNLDKIQDDDLNKFVNFEKRRIKEMIKNKKIDLKYFYPIYQELKLSSQELGLKGIVDAVYINPEDDKIIVIDWKTGGHYINKYDEYRFELTVYAELLRVCKEKEVGYIGIYFTDHDKLFFEKLTDEQIQKTKRKIKKIRNKIDKYMKSNNFPKKKNMFCKYCQFKEECEIDN